MATSVAWVRAGGKLALPSARLVFGITEKCRRVKKKRRCPRGGVAPLPDAIRSQLYDFLQQLKRKLTTGPSSKTISRPDQRQSAAS